MTAVGDLSQRTPFEPAEGVLMRAWWGERTMVNVLDMAPGCAVPAHAHPEEQIGLVTEGLLVLVLDGEEHRLGAGHAYTIPGGVRHSGAAGPEGCKVVDVFTPVREDYRAQQGAADAAGA
jgi:quercetin dioxygenase-like cupin family protein